jgi:competence protein ComEC
MSARSEASTGMSADLRLVGVAAGTWLASLTALYLSAGWGAVLALASASSAGLVGWLVRHRWRWILAGVLLGAACGAAMTAARVAVRDGPAVSRLIAAHATVHMRLIISDDPRPIPGASGRPGGYVIPASAVDPPARVLVIATDPAWRTLLPGTPVTATGRLAASRGGDLNAAVLSVSAAPDAVGVAPWSQRAAGALRAGLRRACAELPAEPGGLLPGLVDGDTSGLDPGVTADFRTTGMTHLVAVSGANVAIVLAAVLLLARWCRAGPTLAALLCALALLGFVILARPSPSVLRAAVMGGLGLVALALGRPRAAVPALAATVIALLLVDPALAADPGFTLSAFACAGLLLVAPPVRDVLRRWGIPAGLAEALAIPAAAEFACAPVIAGLSATVSLVAVPANLLAEPAVPPATILGVLAAVVSVPWPAGAAFLTWLGSWPARWLVAVAHTGARAPDAILAWPGGTGGALLLAALLGLAWWAGRRAWIRVVVGVCAVAAALGAVPVQVAAPGWPPAGALAVVCDVGQGDAIAVPVGSGSAVVVDTGPDPRAVDRCLRDLGVETVPLLMVSHFHIDHTGGVSGVFHARRVGAVVTTELPEPAYGHQLVATAAAGARIPVSVVGAGWSWVAGPVRLTVLGPVHRLAGTNSDPNNNSLVVLAEVDGVRLLLAGDAQVEEQADLLAALGPDRLRADVLKVAHHGSAYQDPDFLAAVHPRLALVSVGAGNPYGHPNLAVLEALRVVGARVLRTDLDGDLAAVVDGHGLEVVRRGTPAGAHPP